MKQYISILFLLLFAVSVTAQSKVKMPDKFDVVVSFGSMASGPSSDQFLKDYVKSFSKKNKVSIPAYKASGCGREGEFNILFCLSKLKKSVKKKFLADVNALIPKQEAKNKAANSSSGSISVEHDKKLSDYSFCRGGIAKW